MSTLVLDGVTPRARTTDPTTSVDAGRVANLTASQRLVLDIFTRQRGPLADHQLVAWAEGTSRENFAPSRIRSARSELTELGVIVLAEGTVKTPRGIRAQLWRLA